MVKVTENENTKIVFAHIVERNASIFIKARPLAYSTDIKLGVISQGFCGHTRSCSDIIIVYILRMVGANGDISAFPLYGLQVVLQTLRPLRQ